MEEKAVFQGWLRIDDRLIHGQVTVGWRQHLRFGEIWVVDDAVRDDPHLGDALRLAAPAGVTVQVMGVEEAADALVGPAAGRSLFVLVREPEVVVALMERGVPFARVNVGNLASRPGSVRAIKSISLTGAQTAVLDSLADQGIEVFFQLAPEDARISWEVVRRRLRG